MKIKEDLIFKTGGPGLGWTGCVQNLVRKQPKTGLQIMTKSKKWPVKSPCGLGDAQANPRRMVF
jgi:hypothetical protein